MAVLYTKTIYNFSATHPPFDGCVFSLHVSNRLPFHVKIAFSFAKMPDIDENFAYVVWRGERIRQICARKNGRHTYGEKLNWKEDFVNLKEVTFALRKFEHVRDERKVSFEANLLINSKLMEKLNFSLLKTDSNVIFSKKLSPFIFVRKCAENSDVDDGVTEFLFELTDL